MRQVLAALVIAGLAACSSESPAPPKPSVTRVAEPDDVIDEALMIALAQAKNFHHKAQVYTGDGNGPEAINSVRQILSLRFPAGAPEADDVRNDARALLGKLYIEQGQLDEAMRTVDEGLAASPRQSFFVANLYTVRGEVHEARAKLLDATDKPTATAERHAAIEDFERSIKINEALQKKLMEDR